ncbi:MAG: hypothetical protein J6S67_22265 [Methanobrevibacter sp.]|nr:hypothetical protein [Methanobrevibacter sp.]
MTLEAFKLPAGRIVGGHPTKFEQAIDYYTKQPKMDKNGQPLKEHRIDLAIPKAEFMQQVWPYILQEVIKVYPQLAQTNPEQLDMARFAWKIINGDSPACPQGSNVPYNTRDGYAGCYIIKIRTSAFAPNIYKFENGAYRKIDENEIKVGDFIVANVNVTVHTEKDGGIYWNPNAYELIGYGQAIKGSTNADPMKLFGGQQTALPAGASATPISSAPANASMPGVATPAMQAPMAQPVAQAMPAPAYDFVQNAGMPQAQPAATNWNMPTQPTATFNQSVAPAAGQQQSAHPMAATTAPNVISTLINR